MFTLVEQLNGVLSHYPAGRILVVQDRHVVLPAELAEVLRCAGAPLLVEGGETAKCVEHVAHIWDALLAREAGRDALVVCVGGGSVTDSGGFAAATYKRGIDYVNIPTTLLAMVDAAEGGKTGINYGGLKNAVGVFRAPVATVVSPAFLESLPAEELLSGYGEMLKHALLDSEAHWHAVLRAMETGLPGEALITRSAGVKARFVEADLAERGVRKALNIGHTVGHALEAIRGGELKHGYAVVYGLVAELYMSHVVAGLDKGIVSQMAHVMSEYYGRPQASCKDNERLMQLMRQDKKNSNAKINFTLLEDFGKPVLNQMPDAGLIDEALDYLFSI